MFSLFREESDFALDDDESNMVKEASEFKI